MIKVLLNSVIILCATCVSLASGAHLVGSFLTGHQLVFASAAPDYSSRQITMVDIERGLRIQIPINLYGNFSISPHHLLVFVDETHNLVTRDFNDRLDNRLYYSITYFDPAWHPDNISFAFTASETDLSTTQQIYLSDGYTADSLTMEQSFASIWGLAWSPDGSYITFTGMERNFSPVGIYRLTVANGEIRRVTPDDMTEAGQADWSPDGRYLAFWGYQNNMYDIFVMDFLEDTIRNLTQNQAWDASPVWSPDGTQLVFISSRIDSANTDIYIMEMDSGNVRRLTEGNQADAFPVWSPDGAYIAFESFTTSDLAEVYVMRSDGSEKRLFSDRELSGYSLLWLP